MDSDSDNDNAVGEQFYLLEAFQRVMGQYKRSKKD
jgi:hypothetical protein